MNILQHKKFDDEAAKMEDTRGLPRGSLRAIMTIESRGKADAVSEKGARGAMQFMPETAKEYNVDTSNPWDSMRGAADYLHDLKKQHGNMDAAVSAYNGGAYNARYFKDGKAPSIDKVSPKNHQVNKQYVNDFNKQLVGPEKMVVKASAPSEPVPQRQMYTKAYLESIVAKHANDGQPPLVIVNELKKIPGGEQFIERLYAKGYDDTKIASVVGGQSYAKASTMLAEVKNKGVLDTLDEGTKIGLQDIGQGARQLWARATGTEADVKKLQAEQAAREADPRRRAILNTTSGTVGNFVGTAVPGVVGGVVAAAAAPVIGGGAALGTLGAAAAGAAGGALTPTTGEGQIGRNMAIGGVLNAVPGLGKMGAKAVGNAIDNRVIGDMAKDDLASRIARYQAAGIDPSKLKPSQLFEGARNITSTLDTHVTGANVFQPKGPKLTSKQQRVISDEIGEAAKGGILTASKIGQGIIHNVTGGLTAPISATAAVTGNALRRKLNNPKNTQKLIDKVMREADEIPVPVPVVPTPVPAGRIEPTFGDAPVPVPVPVPVVPTPVPVNEPLRDTIVRVMDEQPAVPQAAPKSPLVMSEPAPTRLDTVSEAIIANKPDAVPMVTNPRAAGQLQMSSAEYNAARRQAIEDAFNAVETSEAAIATARKPDTTSGVTMMEYLNELKASKELGLPRPPIPAHLQGKPHTEAPAKTKKPAKSSK